MIDPYKHLSVLKLPRDYDLKYYEASDLIDSACHQLLSRVGKKDDIKLIVGFSIKYQMEPNGEGGVVPTSPAIDVIQIATRDTVYVFKVRLQSPLTALQYSHCDIHRSHFSILNQ